MEAPLWDSITTPKNLMGFSDLVGFRVSEWAIGSARLELEVNDAHLNYLGIMHGGVGATLLDAAMGIGLSNRGPGKPRGRSVTLSLNTQFVKAAHPGLLIAESRRVGGGQRTIFMEADIRDKRGTILMTGQGTFKLLD